MIPVLKYGYSCQLECAQTNVKLVSCGIYPRRTLIKFNILDQNQILVVHSEYMNCAFYGFIMLFFFFFFFSFSLSPRKVSIWLVTLLTAVSQTFHLDIDLSP